MILIKKNVSKQNWYIYKSIKFIYMIIILSHKSLISNIYTNIDFC